MFSNAKFEFFLDVRSGSVGGAIIASGTTQAEVLFATRVRVPIQEKFDADRVSGMALQGVRDVIETLRKQARGSNPSRIHVTLGSPWHVCQTRSVTHKSDVDVRYDNDFVNGVFEREEIAFKEQFFPDTNFSTIERKILAVYLNGYLIGSPLGKKAKELDISFYLSATPIHFKEALLKQIGSVYAHREITFHTFPLLALVACNNILSENESSYLLIDLGGEISDASFIKNGAGIESISFPLGAHSIIRDVAKKFATSLIEAESLYKAFRDKSVTSAVAMKIESVLSDVRVKWTTYISGILQKFATEYILSRTIVLIGNKETVLELKSIFEQPDISQLTMSLTDVNVLTPDSEVFLKKLKARDGVAKLDVFLAVEIFTLDKLF